ncbi:aromatic ring-hydroxylating dioxygenase subunit alpha [Alteraurantiacibacter aestuarii]|uniref:Rieske 2Fe-2S domain-containing protein n=1 Tax=Alteraurantiacibacter aestuarii TaxID=650004 RepID=A0A844ZLD8_9SPHN|nr:aromatic ring-hydroxylating dioxygenase subunit alpha [Alteraurantiacibacter aestuarii]MXO88112.1 Rieske 2Fe-2S domain-containing protein [Alteraurantiacibacter aestuarii]
MTGSASQTQGSPRLVSDQASWSLPAWTYNDESFLALERQQIFMPAWHLVCHVSDIPNPGDYRAFAMMGERAIVVRGKDGQVRAFHNVCRHRAARLLDGSEGNCGGRITCPYHAWSFALDGKLLGVPFIEEYENFAKGDFGLFPIEQDISGGFVYIRFQPGGPSLAEYLAPITQEMGIYRFDEMQPIGPIRSRIRKVNWKNACDNYVDALHIRVAHPGLSSLVRDSYRLEVDQGVDKIFADVGAVHSPGLSVQAYRDLLPDVDHLPEDRKRMWTYYRMFPALMFDVYPDQIDFMQFIPVDATTCILRDGAYALPDDRREMHLTRYLNQRLNRDVNTEDKGLIERVQDGMGSSSFSVGPLGRNEICLRSFANRMRDTIPISREPQRPSRERLEAALEA